MITNYLNSDVLGPKNISQTTNQITNNENNSKLEEKIEKLKKDPKQRTTLSEDDFMKLFITQLEYQDPMHPMNSEQMATQVAQFNLVDLMYKNNESMEKLVKADTDRTRLDTVSLLGKFVRYKGDQLYVDKNGPKPFEFDLADPAAQCICVITDQSGRIIKNINLGPLSSGNHKLSWDGTNDNGDKVKPGTYTIHITAKDIKGKQVKVTDWTTGIVSSVEYPKDETALPQLLLNNGAAKIDLGEIEKVTN